MQWGTKRLNIVLYAGNWTYLRGEWGGQQQMELYIAWRYDFCMLAGLESHHRRYCCGYVQCLPWCCTEEVAPWISQQMGLLIFHIACVVLGITMCWCCQCLLTVGGNLLPHTVTPFRCWHDGVDRPSMVYTLQNACQEHCRHHSDSGQQVSSLPVTVPEVPAICLLYIGVLSCHAEGCVDR